MSLIVSENSGNNSTFIQVPVGMHLAMCYRIIDLGTQQTEYQGTVKHQPKVMFQFEVHGEGEDGKPLVTPQGDPLSVSKNFTLSLGEQANLRKDLQTWRGREFTAQELKFFDLKDVLGAWCMLSITHREYNGKTYSSIANINPVPVAIKKAGLPTAHNPLKIFSIANADMALFETFSTYIQDKIKSSPQWESNGHDLGWKQEPVTSSQPESVTKTDPMDGLENDLPF